MGDPLYVDAIRRRLLTRIVLRSAVNWLSLWAFAWGLSVLVLRAGFGVTGDWLMWGGAAAVPVVIGAWLTAWRKMPTTAALTALMDRSGGYGGLMMAGAEVDTAAWQHKMATPVPPQVEWDGGRAFGILVIAAAFVVTGFAIPQRMLVIGDKPLDLSDQSAKIARQIETLEQEKIIDAKQADELKARLGQVRDQAVASDPTKSWEAMDQLHQALSKAAEEAAEKAVNQTQKLAEASALAEAVEHDQQKATPQLDPAVTAEALANLAKTLEDLKDENAAIKEAFNSQGLDPGKLDPSKPSNALKQLLASKKLDAKKLDAIKKALEKLKIDPKQLGLVDPETLKKLKDSLGDGKLSDTEREQLEKELKSQEFAPGETPPLTPEQLDQLQDLLDKAGIDPSDYELLDSDEAQPPAPGLTAEQLEQLKQLTPEQLEQLKKIAKACRGGKLANGEMLKRLAEEGLIDPSELQALEDAGDLDPEALALMLGEAGKDPAGIGAALRMAMRGPGGPGGGGPAPLTWKDPSSEVGTKFKQTALPAPKLDDIKQSQLTGVSLGAPTVNKNATPDTTGALAQAQSGGGSAATQAILPKHRAVVEKYFKRP